MVAVGESFDYMGECQPAAATRSWDWFDGTNWQPLPASGTAIATAQMAAAPQPMQIRMGCALPGCPTEYSFATIDVDPVDQPLVAAIIQLDANEPDLKDGYVLPCCERYIFEATCTGGTGPYTTTIETRASTFSPWIPQSNPFVFEPNHLDEGFEIRAVCEDSLGATDSTTIENCVIDYADCVNPIGAAVDYYWRHCNDTIDELNAQAGGIYGATLLPTVSEPVNNADNGAGGNQGQQAQMRFRAYSSHLLKDDPILAYGQPGGSHLHLFWGNTCADAFSTVETGDPFTDLCMRGGSSVQGGAGANRTAYWMPALVDGPLIGGRDVLIPSRMRMYYKSLWAAPAGTDSNNIPPAFAGLIPAGLQLLGGNVYQNGPMGMVHGFQIEHPTGGGNGIRDIEAAQWGFYGTAAFPPDAGGIIRQPNGAQGGINHIPPQNPLGYPFLRCIIGFPFLVKLDGNGDPMLTSPDFKSHAMDLLKPFGGQGDDLPTPIGYMRIPNLQYLIDWPCPTDPVEYAAWAETLRLSSDRNADTAAVLPLLDRGGSLHGDVFFAWNKLTNLAWMDGCYNGPLGERNCTNGQLGQIPQAPLALSALPAGGQQGIILNDQTIGVTQLRKPDPYDT